MWIVEPALLNVPQPRLVPHHNHAEDEAVSVVHASPAVFAELHEGRWLVLCLAPSPPSFDLSFRKVQLFSETQQLEKDTKINVNWTIKI